MHQNNVVINKFLADSRIYLGLHDSQPAGMAPNHAGWPGRPSYHSLCEDLPPISRIPLSAAFAPGGSAPPGCRP
jgi:hypothetical protein